MNTSYSMSKHSGLVSTVIKSKINDKYQYQLSFKKELVELINKHQYTHIEYIFDGSKFKGIQFVCTKNVQAEDINSNNFIHKITKVRVKNTEMSNESFNYTCMLPIEVYSMLIKPGYKIHNLQFKINSYNVISSSSIIRQSFQYRGIEHNVYESVPKTIITNNNNYSLITNYKSI